MWFSKSKKTLVKLENVALNLEQLVKIFANLTKKLFDLPNLHWKNTWKHSSIMQKMVWFSKSKKTLVKLGNVSLNLEKSVKIFANLTKELFDLPNLH